MVGLRGDVGKIFVYKQRDGKTIVSKVPKKPSKSSNIQAAHRNGFKKAIKYAKKIKNNNLDLYGKYEEMAKVKHLTAYNLIVKDYLSVPEITEVNVDGDWVYTATIANSDRSGTKIHIKAYDIPGNVSEKKWFYSTPFSISKFLLKQRIRTKQCKKHKNTEWTIIVF